MRRIHGCKPPWNFHSYIFFVAVKQGANTLSSMNLIVYCSIVMFPCTRNSNSNALYHMTSFGENRLPNPALDRSSIQGAMFTNSLVNRCGCRLSNSSCCSFIISSSWQTASVTSCPPSKEGCCFSWLSPLTRFLVGILWAIIFILRYTGSHVSD